MLQNQLYKKKYEKNLPGKTLLIDIVKYIGVRSEVHMCICMYTLRASKSWPKSCA